MSEGSRGLRRTRTRQQTQFKGLEWFEGTFGLEEKNHEYLQEHLKCDPETNVLTCPNGQRYHVGHFSTPTVQELCHQVGLFDRSTLPQGNLRIIHTAVEDVLVMHSEPIMHKATFQVASQFNCLEFPSSMNIPEHGIKEYVDDGTQGPACSLAAAPGTLFRNYLVRVRKDDEIVGQRKKHQLNNLAGVQEVLKEEFGEAFLKVSNGYTRFKISDLKKLSHCLHKKPEIKERIVKSLRVGVQRNTEVVFNGRAPEKDLMFPLPRQSKPQLVTQVFCSAMSLSEPLQDVADGIAPLILRGCYKATLAQALLSAIENKWEHNSHKVVLTFVGGGAFGNREEWINDAIARACADFAEYPLEVYIAHYRVISDKTARDINERIGSYTKERKGPPIHISQGNYTDVAMPEPTSVARTQSGPAQTEHKGKPVARTLSAPAQNTSRKSQVAKQMDVAADHEDRPISTDTWRRGDDGDDRACGDEADGTTANDKQTTHTKRNKLGE